MENNEIRRMLMTPFQRTQQILDKVLPVPVNLPKIYLLGDTGAGKTTIIRQMLGTAELRFPSVRRTRTTIAVTEYVVSKDPSFKAVVVFKPIAEIERYINEILEDAIIKGYKAFRTQNLNEDDLITYLEESPDQRFRLKFMLNEENRRVIAKELKEKLFPKLSIWINDNFPNESDDNTAIVIDLALEDGLRSDIKAVEEKIFEIIKNMVLNACSLQLLYPKAEHFEFENTDLDSFVKILKPLLDAEEGSISPVIERARVRGNIIASWIPKDIEIVLIDGEGIGHDIREAGKNILSSRHLDYFYTSDSIMLVEDSERPFIGGGKSAVVTLAKNGYLSKTSIAFSKLDKIDGQRPEQIQEVKRGLRNLINALSEEDKILINEDILDVRYLAQMNDEPDEVTKKEIINLLEKIKLDAQKVKPTFICPKYDLELLAPFLDRATTEFRLLWDEYLLNTSSARKPWQTVKAFNYRMTWGQDDYKDMKPVADLHDELMTKLEKFINSPTMWEKEVTNMLQEVYIERFKREFSHSLVQLIREILVVQNKERWKKSAELRGTGSTRERAEEIISLIHETVPSMTDDHARRFKDSVKECLLKALQKM